MHDVFNRAILVAAAIATAAIGVASPVGAVPTGHSPSYQNGYDTEHAYYSIPQNHAFLKSEMQQGYDTGLVCRLELAGGAPPPNQADWLSGCVDALHDLGFKP
jgi:hypothetical protein